MTSSKKGRKAYQPRLEDLISLEEASKLSSLTPDHLRRLVRQGDLWGKKIGRNWVTTAKAVKEYVARDRRPGPKRSKRI